MVAARENVALVAPEMAVPFFFHWYVNGAVPEAATEKVAGWPAVTVSDVGCVVIDGATTTAYTVSVAALDVAEPAELLTTTV